MQLFVAKFFQEFCKVFDCMDYWKYFSRFANKRRMTLLMILLVLLGGVEGGRIGSVRDTEPQKRYDISPSPLQIPAIKTIKSEDGDIYDCIDIHTQPAFDHPLLKNHSIQMKPSFHQREVEKNLSSKLYLVKQIWRNKESCPMGTIPIQRNRKEDLPRAFSFPTNAKEVSNDGQQEQSIAYYSQSAPYSGAKSIFNAWNVQVEPNEYSVNLMELANKDQSNFIIAGYGVWPKLFGDNQSRFLIAWTKDGGKSTGCFNNRCPGFVQVSSKIALGGTISPLSSYGGTQYIFDASIMKDNAQSSWWLQAFGEMVGYWPLSIFSDFQAAEQLYWGGIIDNNQINGHHTSTQMGSGHFANEGWQRAAYMNGLQVMGSSGGFVTPSGLGYSASKPNCYSIMPATFTSPGASFFYGGPGSGDSGCV